MMPALRLLVRRDLRRHPLRTVFALTAVAGGTASIVAAALLYDAFVTAYERGVDLVTQGADLQIANGEVGVPEALVDVVRGVPGVAAADAVVHGPVVLRRPTRERLYLYGVDVVAEGAAGGIGRSQAVVPDPLLFVSDPDSVAVTRAAAERHGWHVGRSIDVQTVLGAQRLIVRGVFEPTHWGARSLGDRLLVMDLPAAQRLMAMEDRVSHIDIRIAPGAVSEEVAARLAAVIGARGQVLRPAGGGETMRRLLRGYRYALAIGAGLALAVAAYVVVNAMVISVAQKRHDLGILALLGLTRRQLHALVACEALVLGSFGCAVGTVLGWYLARALATAGARSVSLLYLQIDDPVVRFDPGAVALAVTGALAIVVAAASGALREAARGHAFDVLRDHPPPDGVGRAGRGAMLAGALTMAAAAAAWAVSGASAAAAPTVVAGAVLAALVGATLIVPLVVRMLMAVADRALGPRLGAVALLVSRTMRAELGRVALMSSALLASLAGIIGFAALLVSLERSLATGLQATFANVDLVVTAGGDPLSDDTMPITAEVVAQIARIPGVGDVDAITAAKIPYQGSVTALVASDARLLADGRRDLQLVAPDRRRALAALAAGSGVLVTNTFARRFARDIGDTLSLATPSGAVQLPIVGRYLFEPSAGDIGAIKLDQRLFRRLFGRDTATAVHVTLASDADPARIARRLQRQLGKRHDLFVVTTKDVREQYHAVLGNLSALLTPMVTVACLLGSLGLLAGRLATVEGRRRLLEVLRSIGATRRQCSAMIVGEALVIGVFVAGLAVLAGSLLGYLEVRVVLREACGIDVPYTHPAAVTIGVVLGATAIGVVSGYAHQRLIAWLPRAGAVSHG